MTLYELYTISCMQPSGRLGAARYRMAEKCRLDPIGD
jgi:hypothetical protein